MANIHIPFKPRFRDPLLNGRKIMTCRTQKYGKPGDTFKAFGATFVIQSIFSNVTLEHIAQYAWEKEGCASRADFESVWKSIHPIRGFDPDQKVIAHYFKRIA